MMKPIFTCLFSMLMLVSQHGYCNAAQPGIFQAGGAANFVLLYPADSNSFRKIQMIDEHVTIQLYRGFAVVKGEYFMYNTTDSVVSIKVGYPVNSALKGAESGSIATHIFFDELYALKSYTDGKDNSFIIQPAPARLSMEENNWYVWENSFKPKDTTVISVYFIVNTNNTIVREGYTVDKNNGFVYLLESGATWKQPILRGDIKIMLMDGLRINDIRGLLPSKVFKVNTDNNTLLYSFSNLSPTVDDNVILVYTPNMEAFDFGYITQRRQVLFGSVDSFSKQPVDNSRFAEHEFNNPYKVRTVNVSSVVSLFAVLGLSILGLILVVILLRFIIRRIKDQRPSRGTEI